MQVVLPAWPGIAALHLNAEAGLLLPWGARAQTAPTSISDRFFLGGMVTGALRGFMYRGVGPSAARRPPQEERPLRQDGAPQVDSAVAGGSGCDEVSTNIYNLHFCVLMLSVHPSMHAKSHAAVPRSRRRGGKSGATPLAATCSARCWRR